MESNKKIMYQESEAIKTVKRLQDFFKKPFFFSELDSFCDTQQLLLLDANISSKMPENEYNAIFDTIFYLMEHFRLLEDKAILTQISVSKLFSYFLETRNNAVKLEIKPTKGEK